MYFLVIIVTSHVPFARIILRVFCLKERQFLWLTDIFCLNYCATCDFFYIYIYTPVPILNVLQILLSLFSNSTLCDIEVSDEKAQKDAKDATSANLACANGSDTIG